MSDMQRWHPGRDLERIRDDFLRWVGPDLFSVREGEGSGWGPRVDVTETDETVTVTAEIPGISPEEIDISVTEEEVTLRGEIRRSSDIDEAGYRRRERRYGAFSRVIPLPSPVKPGETTADYHDGILDITIPKSDTARKSFRPRINRRDR